MTEDPTDTCPECGGQLATDSEGGETVCRDCGLVVQEGETDHGPGLRAFDVKENLTVHNSDDISPTDIQPHADLSGASLYDTDLSGAELFDADLSNADLTKTSIFEADLSGADISGADLRGADIRDADISNADFQNMTQVVSISRKDQSRS